MPETDTEAIERADAEMAGMAGERQQHIAELVPEAREPLTPAALNSLAAIVDEAVVALSGGQRSPVKFPEVMEPQPKVPMPLAGFLLLFAQQAEAGQPPPIKQYAFDAVELMQTNGGLDEMQSIIGTAGRDAELIEAMQGPVEAEDESEAEDAAEAADTAAPGRRTKQEAGDARGR